MAHEEKTSFLILCRKFAVPFVLIVSLASWLTRLRDDISRTGLIPLALSSLLASAAWAYYVFTRKSPSTVQTGASLPRFDTKARLFAVALVFIAFLSVLVVTVPRRPYSLPQPTFVINNDGDVERFYEPEVEFYLTVSVTPVTDSLIANGKLQVVGHSGSLHQVLSVPPRGTIDFEAAFLAPEQYRAVYEDGLTEITFVLHSPSGRMLKAGPIPFQKYWLMGEMIVLR